MKTMLRKMTLERREEWNRTVVENKIVCQRDTMRFHWVARIIIKPTNFWVIKIRHFGFGSRHPSLFSLLSLLSSLLSYLSSKKNEENIFTF
jgi:hypothetical protein